MDNSPLSKLPRELRDLIWGFALQRPSPVILYVPGDEQHCRIKAWRPRKRARPAPLHALALASTCKQVRIEALPLFYKTNHFQFETDLFQIGRKNCDAPAFKARLSKLAVFRVWVNQTVDKNNFLPFHIDIKLGTMDTRQTEARIWLRRIAMKSARPPEWAVSLAIRPGDYVRSHPKQPITLPYDVSRYLCFDNVLLANPAEGVGRTLNSIPVQVQGMPLVVGVKGEYIEAVKSLCGMVETFVEGVQKGVNRAGDGEGTATQRMPPRGTVVMIR